jgi:hypothetical protein
MQEVSMRKLALVFSALFLGLPNIVMADMAQQVAQQQNRSQMDSVYQERLRAANTPEERPSHRSRV